MAAVAQKHKIMRQVLELRGCPEGEARRLHAELRETYYRRLVPLIEKVCSSLGAPDRVDRIETLEIDLGAVALDALESGLAAKFEAAFAGKLAAAIGAAPALDADLELFERFIGTGTVPWWADLSDRQLLSTSLARLIARSPQALRRAMRVAPVPERMLRRVAAAYPDRLLAELCAALAPPLMSSLAALLVELAAAWVRRRPGARSFWWEETLKHSLQLGGAWPAGGSAAAAAQAFLRAVLVRLARRLRVEYRVLVEELRRAPDVVSAGQEIVQALSRETDGGIEAMRAARGDAAPHAGLLARLREIRRLPAHLQAQAAAALASAAFQAGVVDEKEVGRMFEELPQEAPLKTGTAPSSFSEADAVYVENAGLVILWPFLQPFFANVGLLEEKAFKDPAARQRAVGLLQYVATGAAPEGEHLLPLDKVLCGLPPEEVFEFGAPITEAEIEACDDLLRAVIGHAPILNRMSIPGFRASFLARKGQLGARDGNWLLRVERETHDVVLDRFPWSFPIVKLPWMKALLQVEW